VNLTEGGKAVMKMMIFAAIALIGISILITIVLPFLGIVLFLTGILLLITILAFRIIKNKIKEEKAIFKVEMITGFTFIGASALVSLLTFPFMEMLGIAILLTGVIWLILGLSR